LVENENGKEVINVKKYNWKDAYSFSLGWDPFTNKHVDYFDLHHNLWNIKTKIKSTLNTNGCSDCDFITDIKNGFTPLESLSGRYGSFIELQRATQSELHGDMAVSTKICGELDLNDSDISNFVYKINIEKYNGDIFTFYLLDSALLFGSKDVADLSYRFPFTFTGTKSDCQNETIFYKNTKLYICLFKTPTSWAVMKINTVFCVDLNLHRCICRLLLFFIELEKTLRHIMENIVLNIFQMTMTG